MYISASTHEFTNRHEDLLHEYKLLKVMIDNELMILSVMMLMW